MVSPDVFNRNANTIQKNRSVIATLLPNETNYNYLCESKTDFKEHKIIKKYASPLKILNKLRHKNVLLEKAENND